MNIIPAIDIYNGKCVRLTQGKYTDITYYRINPIEIAKQFEKIGVHTIHVCDLNRIENNSIINDDLIRKISNEIQIDLQYAGGIQTLEDIDYFLSIGFNKFILNASKVISFPDQTLNQLIKRYKTSCIVSLDARETMLVKNAWSKQTKLDLFQTAKKLNTLGFTQYIYTDITKDGTLTGPNIKIIQKLLSTFDISLIIAGGISTKKQILELQRFGVSGVIIGKAIYENIIDLNQLTDIC